MEQLQSLVIASCSATSVFAASLTEKRQSVGGQTEVYVSLGDGIPSRSGGGGVVPDEGFGDG